MIVTIDIGGTKIDAAPYAEDDALGTLVSVPCPALQGRAAVVDAVRDAANLVIAAHGAPRGIAVSTAGVVDSTTGRIVSATDNMPGWGGTPLAEELQDTFGVPVAVLGDGNAHGLGLWDQRPDRPGSLLAVVVGTGIGGSLILGGEPLVGAHLAAGHLGHVPVAEAAGVTCTCGAPGHLEAVGGGRGVLAWYHRNGGDPRRTSMAQLDGATDDALAGQALALGGSALGAALAGLVNTIDPDVVVVSGGAARAGARWRGPVLDAFAAGLMESTAGAVLEFADPQPGVALRGVGAWAERRWRS